MRRDWLALYARSGGAARVDQRADGEHQPPGDERPATERSDRRQRGAACQVVEAELAAEATAPRASSALAMRMRRAAGA